MAASPQQPSPAPRSGWSPWLVGALLFAAALAVYFPAWRGQFLWDDAGHVTAPELRSLGGLARIWFEVGATQQYYPLLHSAFWLQHQLWGDAVLGYHLINIFWHALAATLFWVLLQRLSIRGAWLAAALFLLHPVAVESVAWISEQKNTLSLVLYLAAALAWLRYEDQRTPRRYAAALLWFAAALLTKTVSATLPAALLVLAWWREGRLTWSRHFAPLLPWLALGVAAGLGTAWLESQQIGARGSDFSLGPVERGLLAGRIIWFYATTLLWPFDLAFFYPRWTIDAAALEHWLYPLTALTVLGGAVWWSRRNRAPLTVALLFGGTLFPVLGFVNVYPFVFSYVADHFQYHANLAVFAGAGALFVAGWQRLPAPRPLAWGLGALLLGTCALLTWRQSALYRDDITLYEATLTANPQSWVAHLNLGAALDDQGRDERALAHLQRANQLKPNHAETLNTLAGVLNQLGRPAEARPLVTRALELKPRFAAAHNTLGVALVALQEPAAGIAAFRRAVELDPRHAPVRVNLAWALANHGNQAEALTQLEQARHIDPASADAEFKTALVLAMQRRFRDAEPHLQRAITLQPDNPDQRHILGVVLLELGQIAAAEEQFEIALSLAPLHAGAQQGLQITRQLQRR